MANYFQFTKKHFEFELKGILLRNRAGFMEDITKAWIEEGKETWEHIYKISTKNRSVDIILFSSVDMRTGKVREIGSDAVRIVLRWTTRNGVVYKKVGKHYRLNTLFGNVERSIFKAQQEVFQLNFKEFTKEVA